ncbi:MAG TPA: hypothetical protein VF945_16900 [Polyangia bacterium]
MALICLGSSTALAAPAHWVATGAPERAVISGGPWVLGEGTATNPTAGYPTPNPGTNYFQPYYHAFVVGDDAAYLGFFDYRPKDLGEAVVAATSTDRGRTWTFAGEALMYTPPADKPNDDGFGHPFVLDIGGRTLLYTLDRSPGNVDAAGLVVSELHGGGWRRPLRGAPATVPPASALVRTEGLVDPDGIIAALPSPWGSTEILYLAKDISVTPNVTTVHVAESWDGIAWDNDRIVNGLVTPARPFVGPRGTLVQFDDRSFGLFFSAGLPGEDADALHFIGYAESDDLVDWTVVNDVGNPILSTDGAKDPTGGQDWYRGRVYAPSAVVGDDGCTVTMMFSGYKTLKPKAAPNDYRQMGRVELSLCGSDDKSDAVGKTKTAVHPAAALSMSPSQGGATTGGCSVTGSTNGPRATLPALIVLGLALAAQRLGRRGRASRARAV